MLSNLNCEIFVPLEENLFTLIKGNTDTDLNNEIFSIKMSDDGDVKASTKQTKYLEDDYLQVQTEKFTMTTAATVVQKTNFVL